MGRPVNSITQVRLDGGRHNKPQALIALYRFPGTQGTERSWCPVCVDQSQHCDHPDRPRPGR